MRKCGFAPCRLDQRIVILPFQQEQPAKTTGTGNELTLNLPPGIGVPVKWIVRMEKVVKGERVRSCVMEAEESGKWKQNAKGSCIGHKRIQSIPPCRASKFVSAT